MKQHKKWIAAAAVMASALAITDSAQADLVLSTFPSGFNLNAYYANWGTATINNSVAGSFSITSSGYGSGYYALPSTLDGSGYNAIQMTLDVAGPVGPPISSAIADLTDADGTTVQFAMQYGLTAGTGQVYTELLSAGFTASAGSTPGLDLTQLTDFNLEDDPGGYSGQYTVTYHDLRLVNVPEPTTMALVGLGVAGLLTLRRRK